jgi:hypothetical protein
MLANVVMIYEEKRENDWRLDIKGIQDVQKKTQPRNFPRNRHCFKDKRF